MARTWIKLYVEALADPKLRTLCPSWRWCWIGLLMLAGQVDDGSASGHLEVVRGEPFEEGQIADHLAVPLATWQEARACFLARGMLRLEGETLVVSRFGARQSAMDLQGRERQRRWKQRHLEFGPGVSNAVSNAVTNALRNGESTESEYPPYPPKGGAPLASENADEAEPKKGRGAPAPAWALDLAAEMERTLMRLFPNRVKAREGRVAQWAGQIDLLHRADERPIAEILAVARWALADPFWQQNIQSGKKLRENWNMLVAQKARRRSDGGIAGHTDSIGAAAAGAGDSGQPAGKFARARAEHEARLRGASESLRNGAAAGEERAGAARTEPLPR